MKLLEYYKQKGARPFELHELLTPNNYKSFAEHILKNTSEATINEVKNFNVDEVWFLPVEDFEVWEAYKLVNNEDV